MNITIALPEIFIAVSSLITLLVGLFTRTNKSFKITSFFSIFIHFITIFFVIFAPLGAGFYGQFILTDFIKFCKITLLLSSAIGIVMSVDFSEREKIAKFELPVLITFGSFGMMAALSADNMISLYMGIEIQSIVYYVMTAIKRDTLRSTESGLKYFILGSLASCLLLYGISLLYGFLGTTEFSLIK